jgi:hypothetical protein
MRSFVIISIILILAAITLPYYYANRAAGAEFVFGGFLHNPLDGNSYLAKMYEGWRGDWQFTLPYTADKSQGAFIFIFYIFLGHFARWVGLSLTMMFHVSRLVGGIVLLTVIYRYIRSLNLEEHTTWFVYLLAISGAGLGYLVVPFGLFTSDFWVSEAFPFLSMYANPHFTIGLALMLSLFIIPRKAISLSFLIWSGLSAFLLAIIAPFGVVIVIVIWVGYFALEILKNPVNWKLLRTQDDFRAISGRMLVIILLGVPVLLYDIWVSYTDPILAGWNTQNLTPSPPLWDFLISLSPAMFFTIPGAIFALRKRRNEGRLIIIWLLMGMILIYFPLGLQRRFIMGFFIPLVALVGYWLDGIIDRIGRRVNVMAFMILLFSLPTNLMILVAVGHGVQVHDPLLYLTKDENSTLEWIKNNTPMDSVILASPETGLFIPAHTGRRVVYGHPFETINASTSKNDVIQFFNKNGSADPDFLNRYGVDYIFYGPREVKLGNISGNYNLVYSNNEVKIYQVIQIQKLLFLDQYDH